MKRSFGYLEVQLFHVSPSQSFLYVKKSSPNLKSEILTYYIFFCNFIFHVGSHLGLVLISFLYMRKDCVREADTIYFNVEIRLFGNVVKKDFPFQV